MEILLLQEQPKEKKLNLMIPKWFVAGKGKRWNFVKTIKYLIPNAWPFKKTSCATKEEEKCVVYNIYYYPYSLVIYSSQYYCESQKSNEN